MKKNLLLCVAFFIALLAGCSTDYEVMQSVDALVLKTDGSTKLIGTPVTFMVTNSTNDTLTSEAVFYINDVAIEGNTFTSETVGEYSVKASYLGVTSQPVLITYHDGSQINFQKNVLIEDYTGTWCGYCPRVAHGIELVHQQTENTVTVAIHRASLNPNSPSYDPYTFNSTELENIINIPGYPKGMLNRMTQWSFPEPGNVSQVIALTEGQNPKLGLAMNGTIANGAITLKVDTKFSKDFEGLKLVVYVLENGLIHEQHNYTEYYNGEDVIANFEHNHVLRGCLTPLLGEAVSSTETQAGNTFTKTFTAPVPATVENAGKLEFVAFMVDGNGNAINVRKASPGETQDFQEIQ